MSRKIDDCVLELRDAWGIASAAFNKRNAGKREVFLTQTYRSNAVQQALFAQGRLPLLSVNALRKTALLGPLTQKQNTVVTNAGPGQSKHNKKPSEAFDVAFRKTDGTLDWSESLFREFSRDIRFANPGIVWGGDWDGDGKSSDERFLDLPHFQTD